MPLSEILPGGPPRDGIPPIDAPKFLPVAAGDGFLRDTEPMIALVLNGDARAYPIRILIWHETVNDTVGGTPIVVVWQPGTASPLDAARSGRRWAASRSAA